MNKVFKDYLQKFFKDYLQKFLGVYLDDIIVYRKIMKGHIQHLELKLQRLADNILYENNSKCEFTKPSIEYQGTSSLKKASKWTLPRSK